MLTQLRELKFKIVIMHRDRRTRGDKRSRGESRARERARCTRNIHRRGKTERFQVDTVIRQVRSLVHERVRGKLSRRRATRD